MTFIEDMQKQIEEEFKLYKERVESRVNKKLNDDGYCTAEEYDTICRDANEQRLKALSSLATNQFIATFMENHKGETDSNYVKLVRCKDCKHWDIENKPNKESDYCLCEYYRCYKEPSGFCDIGESRTEDE